MVASVSRSKGPKCARLSGPSLWPLFWFLSKDPCMESPNRYLSPDSCFARNGCISFEIQGSKVCSTIRPLTLGHCFGFFQGTHVWKAPTSTFHQSLVLLGMVASAPRSKGPKCAPLSAPSHRHNKHSWGWKHEWMPTAAVAVHFSCLFQCVQNQKHTKRLNAFWSIIVMDRDQNIYPPLSPPPEAEPCVRPWPWCQGAQ